MKKVLYLFAAFAAVFLVTATGCKKNNSLVNNPSEKINVISGEVSLDDVIGDLKKIRLLGFDPLSAEKTSDGYRVEGDIHLTKRNLNESVAALSKQQGQYSTRYALAIGRTINVALYNPTNTPKFDAAFDSTVVALKSLKLPLRFVRVADTANADIVVLFKDLGGAVNGSVTLGRDGAFVDSQGNPGKNIFMNSNPDAGYTIASRAFISSVLNHEFGHAIGLRHTDYKNRIYSALKSGGINTGAVSQDIKLTQITKDLVDSAYGRGKWEQLTAAKQQSLKQEVADSQLVNEGDNAGTDAWAAHLYGTPLTPTYGSNIITDPTSIMLAITGAQGNLNFSSYDNIGLFGLYGNPAQIALIRTSLSENGVVTAPGKTLAQIVNAVKNLSPQN